MARLFKDQMTPAERAKAVARGESADRLPCNPNVANGVARVFGCKISEFNTSPRTIADAQIASYRHFGYDGVRIFTDLFPWAEAMGASVVFPEDNTADLLKPAIDNPEDYKLLKPFDPYKDKRLPLHLEAMKYLVDAIGTEVGCSAGVVGPFTNAFFLVGIDKMLRLCLKKPDIVHHLCQISLDAMIAYSDAAIDIGLTPAISEPMSSCTVVSPKVFEKFSAPYLRQLIAHIKSRGKGVTVHICGQTDAIWESIAEMGADVMSIDNVASITDCKNKIGDRCKIVGNVNPATTMYMGTQNEVKLETLECILEGYDNPKGFMPMSGCSLPVETPFQNIEAMLDACSELGYPVKLPRLEELIDKYRTLVEKDKKNQ